MRFEIVRELCSCVLLFIMLDSGQLHAAPSAALGYQPNYPSHFKHFNYVNPDAPKGGELLLSAAGSFDGLNPFLLKGLPAAGLTLLVFEPLMVQSFDEPFSVYGLLANDIQLAEDKLSVTFTLNPKARFSDGTLVTAHDVKFSFDTLMSDKAHPQYRFYWSDIKRCVVIDDGSAKFEFRKINPELHLIIAQLRVFSKNWLQGDPFDTVFDVPPIASGPFVVHSFERGKQIVYRRDPNYWARDLNTRVGMFNFDKVTIKYYKDRTVELEAFKAGEFDYFFENHSKRWALQYEGEKFDTGLIIKTTFKHRNNAGMQGFVFNLRRKLFQDWRVRRAITLALDFEWSNQKLFYGQYDRTDSYFTNTELAASGLPQGAELRLLGKYKSQLPEKIFIQEWVAPSTASAGSLRNNLREAQQLLNDAGWPYRDGALRNATGEKIVINVVLVAKGFERIFAAFARNLSKLGITLRYRVIDPALYQMRADTFDFDMMVAVFPQSLSPGNEQRNGGNAA